jgi:hypothetical protein
MGNHMSKRRWTVIGMIKFSDGPRWHALETKLTKKHAREKASAYASYCDDVQVVLTASLDATITLLNR